MIRLLQIIAAAALLVPAIVMITNRRHLRGPITPREPSPPAEGGTPAPSRGKPADRP